MAVRERGLKECPHCGGSGSVPDPAYYGAEARKTREAAGLSLREVARRMSLSVAYISDLELGRRNWGDEISKRYLSALHK